MLALVLAEGDERRAELLVEIVDVEPEVFERDEVPLVDQARDGARLRYRGDVERAAVGADLELLFEVCR